MSQPSTAELQPRRRPTQERSRRRFSAILQAARDQLVEVGFEAFTCEQVAQRAEVPIGSLYQFFANKYVVVCELDREDLAGVQQALAAFGEEVPSLQWPSLLEKFVDHLAALWRDDPSRRAVWLAMQSTPMTRATAASHERQLAAQVTRLLGPLTPGSPVDQREQIAEVLVNTVYSTLNFSIRDGQSHPDAVIQLKTMLTAYLLDAQANGVRRKCEGGPGNPDGEITGEDGPAAGDPAVTEESAVTEDATGSGPRSVGAGPTG